ncbi:MAG TPA: PadR family transcriptional regulator [Candidatus Thermoplasmatota archaeon]|nr:PadR family transcriptional regulator [Candidatus Thermoplasmatota archaeon]
MAEVGPKVMRGLLEAFVLDSLSSAPKHGYALLKEMEEIFGEEPNRNRIYPLLQRLESEGLVRAVEDPEDTRGRTRYEITELGVEALGEYRRMPRPFRDALGRLWSVAPPPEAAPPVQAAPASTPSTASLPTAPPATAVPAASAARVAVDGPPPAGAPYPCATARVAVEREPRTGRLALVLTGCPMGAYDYCPLCPVYKGAKALDALALGADGR